jgi:hypothetical protein
VRRAIRDVGLALALTAAFGSGACSTTTENVTSTGPSSSAAAGTSSTPSTASSGAGVELFEGEWSRKFVPVGCAVQLQQDKSRAGGNAEPWNDSRCGAAEHHEISWSAGSIIVDASTMTFNYPSLSDRECHATIGGVTANGERTVTVHLTSIVCGDKDASDLDLVLRQESADVVYFAEQRFVRKGAKDPGPTSTTR